MLWHLVSILHSLQPLLYLTCHLLIVVSTYQQLEPCAAAPQGLCGHSPSTSQFCASAPALWRTAHSTLPTPRDMAGTGYRMHRGQLETTPCVLCDTRMCKHTPQSHAQSSQLCISTPCLSCIPCCRSSMAQSQNLLLLSLLFPSFLGLPGCNRLNTVVYCFCFPI